MPGPETELEAETETCDLQAALEVNRILALDLPL